MKGRNGNKRFPNLIWVLESILYIVDVLTLSVISIHSRTEDMMGCLESLWVSWGSIYMRLRCCLNRSVLEEYRLRKIKLFQEEKFSDSDKWHNVCSVLLSDQA